MAAAARAPDLELRSVRRSASAAPRRQAVSMQAQCSASRIASLPLVRATWLISASSQGVSARRAVGSRRGLAI